MSQWQAGQPPESLKKESEVWLTIPTQHCAGELKKANSQSKEIKLCAVYEKCFSVLSSNLIGQ